MIELYRFGNLQKKKLFVYYKNGESKLSVILNTVYNTIFRC